MFADDGSEGADSAWRWVVAQKWTGWQITVLTVQPQGVDHRGPQPPHEWSPANARELPTEADARTVTHMVADGDPREVLTSMPADLLVIGRRGTGLLKRLHIGSVAEALLDNPAAPLLVAHGDSSVQNVVVAVDGSGYAAHAVEVLRDLPWIGSARVTILGVDEGDGKARTAVDHAAKILDSAAYAVDRRVIDYDPSALTVNVRHDIEMFVKKHPIDLIVVGTKGLTGNKRLRLGSVSDYIAHHIDASVLLVRDAYR